MRAKILGLEDVKHSMLWGLSGLESDHAKVAQMIVACREISAAISSLFVCLYSFRERMCRKHESTLVPLSERINVLVQPEM